MPAIKVFIYFVVLKFTGEFFFREGISLVVAGVAAAAITLIEFAAVGLMAGPIGAYIARARFAGAGMPTLVSMTISPYLAGLAASVAATLAIIFAFSPEFWARNFSSFRDEWFWSTLTIAGTILAMSLANYTLLLWAVHNQARQKRLTDL